jgi:hypothetical protein
MELGTETNRVFKMEAKCFVVALNCGEIVRDTKSRYPLDKIQAFLGVFFFDSRVKCPPGRLNSHALRNEFLKGLTASARCCVEPESRRSAAQPRRNRRTKGKTASKSKPKRTSAYSQANRKKAYFQGSTSSEITICNRSSCHC